MSQRPTSWEDYKRETVSHQSEIWHYGGVAAKKQVEGKKAKVPRRVAPPVDGARRDPVQSRSRERMATILDVTARLVDEIGPDQVTTTLIAEEAGISVGSIYSYFSNLEAVFDAIVARSIVTLNHVIADARQHVPPLDVIGGSMAVIDALAEMYRTEPGFRSLWFSTHLSTAMLAEMRDSDELQAAAFLERIHSVGYRVDSPDEMDTIRMYVGLIDKGLDLAFRLDVNGDDGMIAELKRAVAIYLGANLVQRPTTSTPPASGPARSRKRVT